MSSFNRHFSLVSVCFIHNGEFESLRKVVFFLLERLDCFSLFGAWVRVFRVFSSLLAVFFCSSVKLVWVFGIRNFFSSLLFLFMDLSAFCIVC